MMSLLDLILQKEQGRKSNDLSFIDFANVFLKEKEGFIFHLPKMWDLMKLRLKKKKDFKI